MKALIQRVINAHVEIDSNLHSSIENGLLIYVCFEAEDTILQINKAIDKIISLRIFEDSDAKMNLNINQKKQQIMAISQFTLSWDGSKGNRPSFEKSMNPSNAETMYNQFLSKLNSNIDSELCSGVFGANMKVTSTNDGPVTFLLNF